jgi:hypothetical protein
MPAGVSLGESFASVQPRIQVACTRIETMHNTAAMAAPALQEQIQLDCYGLNFYESPRKVEFMFNDGSLAFMWVWTDRAESDRIRHSLVSAHGAPIYQREEYALSKRGVRRVPRWRNRD